VVIKDGSTLPENRPSSEAEIAVIEWLIENASMVGSLAHLRDSVRGLRVVGRCHCGCASVEFVDGGQADGARVIADAIGSDSAGRECGLILWSLEGRISGLEVYEHDGDSSKEIPAVATLKPWKEA
jgi:hypothetical protein